MVGIGQDWFGVVSFGVVQISCDSFGLGSLAWIGLDWFGLGVDSVPYFFLGCMQARCRDHPAYSVGHSGRRAFPKVFKDRALFEAESYGCAPNGRWRERYPMSARQGRVAGMHKLSSRLAQSVRDGGGSGWCCRAAVRAANYGAWAINGARNCSGPAALR